MHPDLLELLASLRSHEVEFLAVGSTALAIYARPRYTEDIALWINRSEENAKRLATALREYGFPISDEEIRPFWESDRQMITVGAKPHAVDMLNFLADDEFAVAWNGRTETELGGVPISVIGLREFVRSKRFADRPKDRADLPLLEEVLGLLPE